MSDNIIQLNEDLIKNNLKDLVRSSVEETLNALIDHEADELVNAEKYERSGDRKGYRSGHYERNFSTTSGDVTLRVPNVGLVGLGVALTASNIISVMMSAFALRSAGPFAAFIGGLFCKNVTKDAGFLSILSGTAVAAYWTYALKSPFGLSAMVPGGIVAFAVLFIVSKYQISRGVEAAAPIELDKE